MRFDPDDLTVPVLLTVGNVEVDLGTLPMRVVKPLGLGETRPDGKPVTDPFPADNGYLRTALARILTDTARELREGS